HAIPVGTFDTNKNSVSTIVFTPDGRHMAFGRQDHISLFDTRTGKERSRLKAEAGSAILAFTPDGKKLVSTMDGNSRRWDVATGRVLHALEGAKSRVESMAVSRGGEAVAFGTRRNIVQLWDLRTGKEMFTQYQGY